MASIRETLLGQRASDVALPTSITKAQLRRRRLIEQLAGTGQGMTEGELAALAAGQAGAESASRDIMALANRARGADRAGALINALNAQAAASQQIAGQTARTAAEARSGDISRAQQMQAALLGEEEQSALAEEELRQQRRRGGLLPGLLSLGGAGLGALYGGAGGAAKGAQIGGTAGSALSSTFR